MTPLAAFIDRHRILWLFVFLVSFSACLKDRDVEEENRKAENKAFYELMQDWYFWYDQMPEIKPNNYPSVYEVLEALRQKPVDRWSYISSRADFDAYYQESKYIGYGFGMGWDDQDRLRITFVFKDSPMFAKGVARGWIIDAINGTKIQPGVDIGKLLGENKVGVSNTFKFIQPDNSVLEESFTKTELVMNNVLHHEVIPVNGKKVGYLVLKGFNTPTVAELNQAFETFTTEGIDEFILDMRYNGGGQTNVANVLASMIGGNRVVKKPFSKYVYNARQAPMYNFVDSFATVTKSLQIERLITICTGATASASELIINGLKPYMPVYIVGDNTYGKPLGMNAWYYGYKYAFVPITFKIDNANNEGSYFNGLPADIFAADDKSRDFGDPEEQSLKAALNLVAGGPVIKGAPAARKDQIQPWEQLKGLRAVIGAY